MEIKLIHTKDGSHTLYMPELDETYHSQHGAIQEAMHVFIENGIKLIKKSKINVLEVGFGTGLNAILTSEYAKSTGIRVDYLAVETLPLEIQLIKRLNYFAQLKEFSNDEFIQIHQSNWERKERIHDDFLLTKKQIRIQDFESDLKFDVIYYDAFGPRAQNEMWEKSIFKNLFDLLSENGFLVTYCAMGQFKRDLKSIGFKVQSLPGPPGKREMTVAYKSSF